jgi:2-polyprenyl-3-methyl-5-hydroxy-6-metoxy-1,4-benzoquinol methylase
MTERPRSVSEDDLTRLKREREEADRRYNEALTALDAAIPELPEFPHQPSPPDDSQGTALNARWEILKSSPAFPAGMRGRLARFVWGLIEPVFTTQQAFNSATVDHINRNLPAQREMQQALARAIALLEQQARQLARFHTHLMMYLQQITPYVDTKDYEVAGLGRRITEDAQQEVDRLQVITRGLAASVSGVSDEMLRRWESLFARDQRYSGRIDDVSGRIDEMRSALAIVRQQTTALKRVVERETREQGNMDTRKHGSTRVQSSVSGSSQPPSAEPSLDAWQYVAFENLFRGSQDEIRKRLEDYGPLFEGASDVLDVGCGRGEFLEILAARGVSARGIDLNREMVEECRSRGLDATEIDALTYLRSQAEGSMGGLIATQVVEHLEPPYLLAFLDQAQRVLRPGAIIVLETINVACWLAFFESYLRDLTHARALHPDTLKYLVTANGFVDAEIQYKVPVDTANRLQRAPRMVQRGDDAIGALSTAFDSNVDRLNRLLFTSMDYAVVARRP